MKRKNVKTAKIVVEAVALEPLPEEGSSKASSKGVLWWAKKEVLQPFKSRAGKGHSGRPTAKTNVSIRHTPTNEREHVRLGYLCEVVCALCLLAYFINYGAKVMEAFWAVAIAASAPALSWSACQVGLFGFQLPGQGRRFQSYTLMFTTLLLVYCLEAQRALPPATMRLYTAVPARVATALTKPKPVAATVVITPNRILEQKPQANISSKHKMWPSLDFNTSTRYGSFLMQAQQKVLANDSYLMQAKKKLLSNDSYLAHAQRNLLANGSLLNQARQMLRTKDKEQAVPDDWWLDYLWQDTAITPFFTSAPGTKVIQILVPKNQLLVVKSMRIEQVSGSASAASDIHTVDAGSNESSGEVNEVVAVNTTEYARRLSAECVKASDARKKFPTVCKMMLMNGPVYQINTNDFKYNAARIAAVSSKSRRTLHIAPVASQFLKVCTGKGVFVFVRREYLHIALVDVPYLAMKHPLQGAAVVIALSICAAFVLTTLCPFGVAAAIVENAAAALKQLFYASAKYMLLGCVMMVLWSQISQHFALTDLFGLLRAASFASR